MKRLLILVACMLTLCCTAYAADTTVTNMKTDITVEKSGVFRVVQTFDLNITGMETELTFPIPSGARKAELVGYDTKRHADGSAAALILESPTGLTGTRSFTFQYSGHVTVSEIEDQQQMDLELFCSRWEYPIEQFSFTVTMPKSFETLPSFVSGYYGETVEDMMDVTVKDVVISGEVDGGLKDHESVQMSLLLDKSYFSGTYAAWSFRWVSLLLIILCLLAALVYWAKKLRTKGKGTVTTSQTLPPESCSPGELPMLLFGSRPDFNFLVLHWASLGYLTISFSAKGSVLLKRRIDMGNERRTFEQKLFAMLFSQGSVCDGASLLYKKTAQKAGAVMYRYWARRIFDKKSGSVRIMQALAALAGGIAGLEAANQLLPAMSARGLLLAVFLLLSIALSVPVLAAPRWYRQQKKLQLAISVICAVILVAVSARSSAVVMLVVLAFQIFTGFATLHGGKRTKLGVELTVEAQSYRKFLQNVSGNRLRSMLQRDGQYYYKTLPYALAMGLGMNFSRLFGDAELEPCDWYREEEQLPDTAIGFYNRLSEAMALLALSVAK